MSSHHSESVSEEHSSTRIGLKYCFDSSPITYSYKRIRQQCPHYYPPHPPHKQLRIVVWNRGSLTSKMNQRNRSSQQFPQQLHAAFSARYTRNHTTASDLATELNSSVQNVSYHLDRLKRRAWSRPSGRGTPRRAAK